MAGEVGDFKEMDVWRVAMHIARLTYQETRKLPDDERFGLVSQMRRTAVSMASNIAEGYGRGSPKENHRFVRISRGSLNETRHWLRRAYNRELLRPAQISRLKLMLDELGPRLNAYLDFIDRSCAGRPRKPTTPNPQPTTNNKRRKTEN